ncbi:TolC family protein [Arcicella rigui]|uniref:TolC family protein n=1 Tax=Arcicella rigui TaxID=797020 RepID=A0ABU5QGI5_9BACT|nr:TolC family protein [Arcicella rigui]MEA5141752.1 TolC family protein [Arcicella rigui]
MLMYKTSSAQEIYTLQKALQTAKANNPLLNTQQLNVGISEADIVTAQLRPNPNLNNQTLLLTRSASYPNNSDWYNAQNRQVWWQLTKVIQLPSQRQAKIDLAQKNTQLSQKAFGETERSVLQDVALKWLDVWTARKQLDILQIAKTNTDSLVSINKIRLGKEVITSTDLTRTALLANQYALQLKSNEQIYQNELLNLKFMLGTQDRIDIDTKDDFTYVFSTQLDSLLQQALANRSDIQLYKAGIQVAESNIKLQKSLATPQPILGMIYNPQNTIPYVGFYGAIDLPFFSRNQGEIKKSYIQKQQAEKGLQATQTLVQTELLTAYNTYQTQKKNIEQFKDLLSKSESILSSVKYSYLHGGTTIVDYLEAQRSWLDTQQQYYDTLQQYRQSYIKLLYASGLINQMAQ